MGNRKQEIENQIKNLNEELETEKRNLIYLLCNVDLKDINIINFHYRFKDLINKIDYLKNELFYL